MILIEAKTKYRFKPALLFDWLTPLYDFFGRLTFNKIFFKRILNYLDLAKGKKILDVGCGTGVLVLLIKQKYPGAEVYGVDADPKILELARKKAQKENLKINFRQSLAEDLSFPDRFFDVVVSSMTLHHIPTRYKKKALRETFRVLKPTGWCLIVDFAPARSKIMTKFLSLQNYFEHTKDHYEGKIPEFISEAGFKNIKRVDFVWPNTAFLRAEK